MHWGKFWSWWSPQRDTELSEDSHTDVERYIAAVVSSVPASPQRWTASEQRHHLTSSSRK